MSPRAQSGRQISETKLAPFPWCSFKEGRSSPLPTLGMKRLGDGSLRSEPCTHLSAHYCPPRATLWDPVPGVTAMVCVPKSLCELPACSPLQHSPHRLFTYKHPAVFKVQLLQAHSQDTWDIGPWSCCQALLLPQANTFAALCLCHLVKLGVSTLFSHKTLNLWDKTTT